MTSAPDCSDASEPEQLIGPLLLLFTRLARQGDAGLAASLQTQLLALARHPAVDFDLRLIAGALAYDPDWLFAQSNPSM